MHRDRLPPCDELRKTEFINRIPGVDVFAEGFPTVVDLLKGGVIAGILLKNLKRSLFRCLHNLVAVGRELHPPDRPTA